MKKQLEIINKFNEDFDLGNFVGCSIDTVFGFTVIGQYSDEISEKLKNKGYEVNWIEAENSYVFKQEKFKIRLFK